jgi:hypothetical protein
MAVRLVERHRVLKPTGSLYLHCDPTASPYLKVVLDGVFGPRNFRNEIIWKRTSSHSDARRYGRIHDSILFYTKTDRYTWNQSSLPLPRKTVEGWYNNIEADTGRRFSRVDLTAAGLRGGASGKAVAGDRPCGEGQSLAHAALPLLVGRAEDDAASAGRPGRCGSHLLARGPGGHAAPQAVH